MNIILKQIRRTKNDIVYTPKSVALKMIDMCNITPDMKVLDPCRGGGVFYDNLNCHKDYCEIDEGKDFFDETKKYDLIIGNPPYSIWDKWIEHTMKLTDKFCYIFGTYNFTDKRVRDIINNGYGVTHFHLLKIDWWFSPSYIVVFEKNKPSLISVEPKRINCESCGRRCKRGQKGFSMNECSMIK